MKYNNYKLYGILKGFDPLQTLCPHCHNNYIINKLTEKVTEKKCLLCRSSIYSNGKTVFTTFKKPFKFGSGDDFNFENEVLAIHAEHEKLKFGSADDYDSLKIAKVIKDALAMYIENIEKQIRTKVDKKLSAENKVCKFENIAGGVKGFKK